MKLVALSLSLLKALSFNSGLLEALFRPDSIYVGAKPALKVKAAALSRPRLSGRTANTRSAANGGGLTLLAPVCIFPRAPA